jgi:hypothetical protein
MLEFCRSGVSSLSFMTCFGCLFGKTDPTCDDDDDDEEEEEEEEEFLDYWRRRRRRRRR